MEHVNVYSSAYRNTLNGFRTVFISAGHSAGDATVRAQAMISAMVQKQAAMLAFVDNFKMLGVVFFGIIPIFLLLKRPRGPAGNVPVH